VEKRCNRCGKSKPLAAFYRDKGARDGHRPECKACTSARRKAWYQANRETEIARVMAWQRANQERYLQRQREYREAGRRNYRAEHLRGAFGLTQADYEALLKAQGGGCAICGRAPGKISLHVDHDHVTGKVRGLLCFRCNGGAGQFAEDVELLARAIDYLESGGLVEAMELDQRARERARELVDARR
jgi:hypothetical protein